MTTVEEIEKAVSKLRPEDLAIFHAWFEEFDAARFDEKIEQDIGAGKLEAMADRALANHLAGRTREL
jgi:hypothetical protein